MPAVFTERTGRDHWEVLLRARAIENGAWVIAAAGCGAGGPGAIPAWGHSMVVDPWGRVVAEAGGGRAIVRADDRHRRRSTAARRQIPALANRRPQALPPALEVDVIGAVDAGSGRSSRRGLTGPTIARSGRATDGAVGVKSRLGAGQAVLVTVRA